MKAVVIGASAGGPQALHQLVPLLAPTLAVAVIIVTHVGTDSGSLLADGLARISRLPVRTAAERMPVEAGVIHVAPAGYHLLVERDYRFALSVDAKVRFSRPSIDVLFASAAEIYRKELLGMILSGANEDGAEGLGMVRRMGGLAFVQDPAEAIVPIMPEAALARAGADLCAPIARLVERVNLLSQSS